MKLTIGTKIDPRVVSYPPPSKKCMNFRRGTSCSSRSCLVFFPSVIIKFMPPLSSHFFSFVGRLSVAMPAIPIHAHGVVLYR